MKLTAKIIPIDLRRRLALEKAHAQEVKAASADFHHRDAGQLPHPLEMPETERSENTESEGRVVLLAPLSPRFEGEAS